MNHYLFYNRACWTAGVSLSKAEWHKLHNPAKGIWRIFQFIRICWSHRVKVRPDIEGKKAILSPQSSVLSFHSSVLNPQSSILSPQSSILSPQS